MIPILHRLSDIAERYDGFIVDLWGVLHDGVRAFPQAVDCLERLRERGKRVLILSNAPRRADVVAARNAELGIPAHLCDAVMSSGEAAWQHLATRADVQLGEEWRARQPDLLAGGRQCATLRSEVEVGGDRLAHGLGESGLGVRQIC